jgi:predicted permease
MTTMQNQDEFRDAARRGGSPLLGGWRQDVIFGIRLLAKNPGFTAVAVLTLALGIGANTAIFSLIDAVMLKSLPVKDPARLVLLKYKAHHSPQIHNSSSYGDCVSQFGGENPSGCSLSKPFLENVRAKTSVFSGMAEFASGGRLNLSANGPASLVSAQYVSGDYFQTLGVGAAVGRMIQPTDDTPLSQGVLVLDHSYWKSAFGGDPGVAGRTIHVNGLPFTIAGVIDQNFHSLTPGSTRDIYVPLAQSAHLRQGWTPAQEDAGSWWIVCVARLKPGVSRELAQSAVSLLFFNDLVHGDKPIAKAEDAPSIDLVPAQTGLTGARRSLSQPLYILMLAVGVVLLIACANVAGLMLARATTRQKEIAVRLALGASRGRIARQLLTESMTISFAGGVLGVLLALWGARALLAFMTSTTTRPPGLQATIDFRVLAFTLAATLLTGVLFGLAPALRSIRVDLTPALKEGAGRGGSATHVSRGWLSAGNLLVVVQVALTVVVLVGAGLLVHTLENLKSVDPGFDTSHTLNFGVDSTLTAYKAARLGALYSDLQQRFSAIPGVLSASYSDTTLLSGSLSTTTFHLPGTPPEKETQADWLPIGPDFFETMRMPLRRGRMFMAADFEAAASEDPNTPSQAAGPAIVNEAFVRAYFPTTNPLGQPFGADTGEMVRKYSAYSPDYKRNPGWVIVGVVGDAKYNNLRREVHPTMYVPSAQGSTFELRTAGDPMGVLSAVRNVVRQAGGDMPIFDITTESEQIDKLLFQERLIARLSSLFGMLALMLACIGLYGLLSYEVTRRTQEIGIRMALGARGGDVLRAVMGQGMALVAIGTALGTAASFAVTKYLRSILFEVKSSDPITLGGVAAILLVVALAACFVPARRATRIDPLVALHCE